MTEPDLFTRFRGILEGGVDEPAAEPPEVVHPPASRSTELGETFACSSCGRFAFPAPTVCYWCTPRPTAED